MKIVFCCVEQQTATSWQNCDRLHASSGWRHSREKLLLWQACRVFLCTPGTDQCHLSEGLHTRRPPGVGGDGHKRSLSAGESLSPHVDLNLLHFLISQLQARLSSLLSHLEANETCNSNRAVCKFQLLKAAQVVFGLFFHLVA